MAAEELLDIINAVHDLNAMEDAEKDLGDLLRKLELDLAQFNKDVDAVDN